MKNIHIILLSALSIFFVMLAFETIKEYFFEGLLTSWQSHWITIIFATIMSLVVTLSAIKKISALKEKSTIIKLKEEKLKSIKQVIYVAEHHVNNLSNNLRIVQIELKKPGMLSEITIAQLNEAITAASNELKKIGEIDDPYDENPFKINY